MPAYNNFYPATYQSPMQYPQYSQQTMPQQIPYSQAPMVQQPMNSNGIIWVSGEIGARAYPSPAAGQSVLLMDSENKRFYIRGTDASGMPLPLRTFAYTEEVQTQHSYDDNKIDTSQFITRTQLEELLNERFPVQNQTQTKRGKSNESAI